MVATDEQIADNRFCTVYPDAASSAISDRSGKQSYRCPHFSLVRSTSKNVFCTRNSWTLMLGLAAEHAVAVVHGHADLAVDAEIGFFFAGLDHDLDFRSIAHHQRAMRQRVRRDRRNHEGVDRRHQDWPAGGQRIGGRTGGRGDDQAVGLVAGNEHLIDINVAMVQARDRALADDHVVERVVVGDAGAWRESLRSAPWSAFRSGSNSSSIACRGRIQLVERNFGQKSRATQDSRPSTGMPALATARAAESKVPSPPSTTTKFKRRDRPSPLRVQHVRSPGAYGAVSWSTTT